MGKFSKKRKRAEIEIAAAASLVISEQPEESAMEQPEESAMEQPEESAMEQPLLEESAMEQPEPTSSTSSEANIFNIFRPMEANIFNIFRPMDPLMDPLKPGEFKRLVLKSMDDSIAMYESLERQGKELPPGVPEGILSRLKESREELEKSTDGSLMNQLRVYWSLKKYMKYFFKSNWQESLYERLRINRVEDGKPALFGDEDDDLEETNFDYYLPTKESHQYAILWDKLQFLLEKKEWDWNQKLDFANSIVATEKLDLYGCHVQACIEDVLGSQDDMKAAQQLEYYHYLFKNEAKNITDAEKLWTDVKEKFPLLNQYVLKSITDCFYPSGKKCDQNELLGIMKEFEFIYRETMKTGFPLPCGKYYKVKQQLALDLGIVKYDSKGFLVDNYNSSEWKIP